MNTEDFYKRINELYDKGTYLEKYGLQAILAVIIIVVVFSAISYLTLKENEGVIVHNWGRGNVKTEKGEYVDQSQTGPDYKCDPRYAPLAGFMSGKIQNKPQEVTYDAEFAAANFTECVTDTLQSFTLSMFNPFLLLASMTHANLGNFTGSMSGIMDIVPKVRRQVALFIQSIFNKLGMFVSYMRKFLFKISDMYQRGIGIAGISLYIFEVIFYQIVAMAQLIISVVNNWLQAVVTILLNIVLVAVITLAALAVVVLVGYGMWMAGAALAVALAPVFMTWVGLLMIGIAYLLWFVSVVTAIVMLILIPVTLLILLFYAIFILAPTDALLKLFPSYIAPDPGAAMALKKGKKRTNQVGLMKYLFPTPPKPGGAKPKKPPAQGETFTGRMSEKLRHCFDSDTNIYLMSGNTVKISKIKLGDVLKDGGAVTAIYKARYDKRHEMFLLRNTIVTGDHQVLHNDNYIEVRHHPESKIIEKYNKRYLYCISTSNKTIEIDDIKFSDWDELTKEEKLRLNTSDIHRDLEGGFSANTEIQLQNTVKAIKDIKLGDKLVTGETVLGIMQIDSKNTECFEYCINGNTIVGGPNIMYQDENLGINTTRDEMKKKRVVLKSPLYHLITDTTMVPIKDVIFFDYQSCLDNLL